MKATKIGLTVILFLFLTACFHTELKGVVSNAKISITELPSGALAQENISSWGEADVIDVITQATWDEWEDILRMAVLGDFFVDKNNFIADRFYLVTVSGGKDLDTNADNLLDAQSTAVLGKWHAVVRGSQLRKGGYVISTITEALYQSVKADIPKLLNAGTLQAQLGVKTRLILNDVNESGNVNYLDALNWTELLHTSNYKLNFSAVNNLSEAITAGAGQAEISELSRIVMGGKSSTDPLQFFTNNISMPIVQGKCVNCHTAGGTAPSGGARLVLVTNSSANHLSINHQRFIAFGELLSPRDLSDYVIGKASGQVGHGGGKQLQPGSEDLRNMETYLNLVE